MSDENPFASAERYYAEFRPGYGEDAPEYLADRCSLDGDARVLDLGCGAGQLTVPLSRRAGEVVAMDPNEAMLDRARKAAERAGRENVTFVRGGDAGLHGRMGPFRLTSIGRSFHWMDQRATLSTLRRITEPGGGVAVLTDREWLTKGRAAWQAAVYEAAARFLDDLPAREDPNEVEYDDPWDEMLAEMGSRTSKPSRFRWSGSGRWTRWSATSSRSRSARPDASATRRRPSRRRSGIDWRNSGATRSGRRPRWRSSRVSDRGECVRWTEYYC